MTPSTKCFPCVSTPVYCSARGRAEDGDAMTVHLECFPCVYRHVRRVVGSTLLDPIVCKHQAEWTRKRAVNKTRYAAQAQPS
jgi:hypothetical protein